MGTWLLLVIHCLDLGFSNAFVIKLHRGNPDYVLNILTDTSADLFSHGWRKLYIQMAGSAAILPCFNRSGLRIACVVVVVHVLAFITDIFMDELGFLAIEECHLRDVLSSESQIVLTDLDDLHFLFVLTLETAHGLL